MKQSIMNICKNSFELFILETVVKMQKKLLKETTTVILDYKP